VKPNPEAGKGSTAQPNTKKPRKFGKTGKNKKIYSQKTNKLHFYFITFCFFFHFFFLSPLALKL
jgi:hypothetical protein